MTDAVVDTHSLIWFLQDSPKLGKEANKIFEACDHGKATIHIPTICLVEIVYLQERARIPEDLLIQLKAELQASNFVFADLTSGVVDELAQISRREVSDMPDRIIAATALHLRLPLISRDRKIQLSAVNTIW